MAKNFPVKISFEAIDKVTKEVQRINGEIAKMTEPARRAKQSLGNLAYAMKLDEIGPAFSRVGRDVSGLFGSITRLGFAATAAVGGLFYAVNSFAKSGDEITDTSKRLGITAESLQQLRYAASLSGLSADDLDTGLKFLNKNMVEAAKGSGDAAKVFQALGISTKFADGRLKTIDEMLPELADKFESIESASLKTSLSMAIFGRSGDKMAPLLSGGRKELTKLREEANALGIVMSGDVAQSANNFDDLMTKLKAAALGVRNTFGAALLPVFTDIAERLTYFFQTNKQAVGDFASALGGALTALVPVLTGFLQSLTQAMREFSALPAEERANKIAFAIKALGFLAVLPTIVQILSLVSSVAGLVRVLGGPLMTMLFAIPKVLAFAQTAFNTIAVAASFFGTILAALPIGWVIAGIAALIGSVYLLYKYWDNVTEAIKGAWDWMKKIAGMALSLLPGGQFITKVLGNGAGAPELGAEKTLQDRLNGEQQRGQFDVNVMLGNLPKGTQVSTAKTDGTNFNLGMGYAMVN